MQFLNKIFRRKKRKPNIIISESRIIAMLALYFTLALNPSLLSIGFENMPSGSLAARMFPVLLFGANYVLFNLLLWPKIFKPTAAALLLISSAANYFMYKYGVFIDADMVRNIIETNIGEASDLITPPRLALWVGLGGILPTWALCRADIKYPRGGIARLILVRVLRIATALALIGAIVAINYKPYSSFARNHREARKLANPINYIYAMAKYFRSKALAGRKFEIIDEAPERIQRKNERRAAIVMIVGETARSMNFQLNGYGRETNPLLSKRRDTISFTDMSSAGTSTAVSMPSIFSKRGRRDFDTEAARREENLLDLLQKAGWSVLWLDNNGCKGVCARVPTIEIIREAAPELCDGTYCRDEALLPALEKALAEAKGDTFIVLHTIGSHGPAYWRRYPERFRKFRPTCDTAELSECGNESIVNTYDNTILYTDFILSEAIRTLEKFPELEAGMLYVSDHGESLGENGLYLHGLPYIIAPKEQTRVPMILWMNGAMRRGGSIDYECARRTKDAELSHDNLFSTILGWTGVRSKTYDRKLDFLDRCRAPARE